MDLNHSAEISLPGNSGGPHFHLTRGGGGGQNPQHYAWQICDTLYSTIGQETFPQSTPKNEAYVKRSERA
jgi:hypothetical protein